MARPGVGRKNGCLGGTVLAHNCITNLSSLYKKPLHGVGVADNGHRPFHRINIDDGCEKSLTCLECPLPECVLDLK